MIIPLQYFLFGILPFHLDLQDRKVICFLLRHKINVLHLPILVPRVFVPYCAGLTKPENYPLKFKRRLGMHVTERWPAKN